MNTKYLTVAALGLATLYANQTLAAGKDGVAAVVNGKKIMVDDIRLAYDHNPATKQKSSFDDFYNNTLDIFVDGEVVYQAAIADGVTDSKDYQQQLKALKEELARKVYLEKKLRAEVDDNTVKKLYQDYKNSLKGQKEVKAKHILVKTEASAKEVIAKLQKDGQFDKLAKEYSKEPADLGWFNKETMVPEFADAAFKLKKGQFTKTPVKTQFGYHVILVEDIRDAQPAPLDKIEPQLQNLAAQQSMGKLIKGLMDKASIVRYDASGKEITE